MPATVFLWLEPGARRGPRPGIGEGRSRQADSLRVLHTMGLWVDSDMRIGGCTGGYSLFARNLAVSWYIFYKGGHCRERPILAMGHNECPRPWSIRVRDHPP